jgi:hypothetical protein
VNIRQTAAALVRSVNFDALIDEANRQETSMLPLDDWVKFGSLLIAIATLIWQQRKAFQETRRKENRVETKLRIFYVLSLAERDMDEPGILFALEQGQPLKLLDRIEVRKALYEMLSDETIRFTTENKYRTRARTPATRTEQPNYPTYPFPAPAPAPDSEYTESSEP